MLEEVVAQPHCIYVSGCNKICLNYISSGLVVGFILFLSYTYNPSTILSHRCHSHFSDPKIAL